MSGVARSTGPESGVALIAALIVMALLSAMGLGLVLTTSLEPAAAANYESALLARYGAEAGVAVAAHELGDISDWDAVLGGVVVSAVLDPASGEFGLPDGSRQHVGRLTNRASCGREDACTEGELDAFTSERPWGPNNPRWRPFGILTARLAADGLTGSGRVVAVVWVGDDPADLDGDPFRDTAPDADGTRLPGSCIVAIRAEAFAPRSAHRVITATITRPAPGCGPGARVVSWRESP